MKKTIICFLLYSMSAGSVYAQIDNSDIDIAQSLFGKSKRMIISDYMQLEGKCKDQFWKMYDQYEVKRKAIEKRRFILLKEYADNFETLDSAVARRLIIGFMNSNDEYNKLHKDYFTRVEKVVGGLKAAMFIQLEIFIQTSIQSDLQSQIPVIGDLERLNKKEPEKKIENLKG